jgi:hypothetical protein
VGRVVHLSRRAILRRWVTVLAAVADGVVLSLLCVPSILAG